VAATIIVDDVVVTDAAAADTGGSSSICIPTEIPTPDTFFFVVDIADVAIAVVAVVVVLIVVFSASLDVICVRLVVDIGRVVEVIAIASFDAADAEPHTPRARRHGDLR
jgi:hypothetical protein